ncbi:MAG: hypothetical protein AAGI01_10065, partial [Myxococcota bacterium]
MMGSKRHSIIIGLSAAFVACMVILTAPHDLSAERTTSLEPLEGRPLTPQDIAALNARLALPDVVASARRSASRARDTALYDALCTHETAALGTARAMWRAWRLDDAERLLSQLIDTIEAHPHSEIVHHVEPERRAIADKARLLLSRVLVDQEAPKAALRALHGVVGPTPIQDYATWMRAEILERMGRTQDAWAAYDAVAKMTSRPMTHRARAKAAHLRFAIARDDQALAALTSVDELYPDYPQRPKILLQIAQTLEAMGRMDAAAASYQRAWFAFPYKNDGAQAKLSLAKLKALGHVPEPPTFEERYTRLRTLRINKHWGLADELFTELAQDVRRERGEDSELYHQIQQQLGLNAWGTRDFDRSLAIFDMLASAWGAGARDGLNHDLIHTFRARNLARLGRFKEALRAIDTSNRSTTLRTRKLRRAKFLKDYAKYSKAKAIYDTLYTPAQKRTWDYAWLTYKSGDFKRAQKLMDTLAARASGSKSIMYQYWAARATSRIKRARGAAIARFRAIAALSPTSYYGLQAANRLLDLERPKSSDPVITVNTTSVVDAGEEALDAFDDPVIAAIDADDPLLSTLDARATPRSPPGGPSHLPPNLGDEAECADDSSALVCVISKAHFAGSPVMPVTADSPLAPTIADAPLDDAMGTDLELGEGAATARSSAQRRPVPHSSKDNQRGRLTFATQGRIFWEGRERSRLAFARYDGGETIGPIPDKHRAYVGEEHVGGLARAIEQAGDLFPELERAQWLMDLEMRKEARWAVREVSREFRALYKRPRPRSTPHRLPQKRMHALIDNRKTKKSTWGYVDDEYRYPVPSDAVGRAALLKRQQDIIRRKRDLLPILVDAMKEVGDYYMVRRFTLEFKGVSGDTRLSQLYPRAFPELVIPAAHRYGV